ncbi:O-antigen/teichoic acid export membrane protein [Aquimarina sp. EL_43]|uniref:oligosaccharide flippase family protein n=1 Tax=unclassified Aquimarina TaxID=2627091 RepID=UPI0018CA9AC2|nr:MULTISPECIES: oligosaccharide flippase family protein [unclassified Aquimarina]MBG6133676.1 O-antigen/teichoic acid export membrane protein [Aquimarina sp. EL_35]MBG6153853.1 O-antigen/teichoic acid export membrane protein [Aquimarina sp. EL_32]MBG6172049.1 O-antigen/teichoic acid export membrane protein [Aquimarina sp. EL_43]
MSQLKKGALLTYLKIFLTNVIGIVITPLIVSYLGKDEYGIFNAIGALIGTIALLDFGLTNTVVRFIAKYRAEKDRTGEENFLATIGILYFVISLLVIILGIVFYFFIDSYFTKFSIEELKIAKVMFVILIFNLAIQLPGMIFTGICKGYEAFVFPESVSVIRYLLRSVTVVAVLFLGGRAISLVIVDSVFNILTISVSAYYVIKKLNVRFKLHKLSKAFIKQILKYSSWIFVFSIVGMLQWKSGSWVLGAMSVPKVLGIYGIGIALGTYYGAFSTAISSVFLPRATQMTVRNATGEELTDMMIKLGRLSFIVLMYVLSAFILYGEQFINLWVGGELETDGRYNTQECREIYSIALIIMIGYTLPLLQAFGNSILEAKNKLSFKAILYLVFMILGAVLGGFLAIKYSALGMISGLVAGWLVVQNVMNFYYHKKIGLNIFRFFKELFRKTLLVVFVVIFIGYFINYIPGDGWLNFVIKGSIYTVIFGILMYFVGMLNYERELFSKPIAAVLKRK